jgi:hypothetical protein
MALDLKALGGNKTTAPAAPTPTPGEPLKDKQGETLAPAQVVESAGVGPEVAEKVEKIYTSAPVMRLKIGKFQFDKGVLTLTDADDVAMFDKLLGTLPPRERNAIRTISMERAIAMVRPSEPGVTKNFDSSVGRQRETVDGQTVIGTQSLEDPVRTESRDDMNIAVNEGAADGTTTAQK